MPNRVLTALFVLALLALGAVENSYVTTLPRHGANLYERENTTWVYPTKRHSLIVQGRQNQLTMLTLGRASFKNPQGLSATSLRGEEDSNERGRLINMTVYGCNTGANSLIYNRSMTSIGQYGVAETGEQALDTPWDLAALPNGLVFVSDRGNHRVVKLRNIDADLVYETAFGQDEPAWLQDPRGIDVTHDGLVFVADTESDRVVQFDTAGIFLNALEGFDRPSGLAAISRADYCFHRTAFTTPRDYFVVCDSGGKRLQKFSFEGERLAVGVLPYELGENAYMSHIELDRHHQVIASDSANNRLLKFDEDLNWLTSWGEVGRDRGQLTGPTGIGIWRRRGRTFVSEQNGAQYLWIGTDVRGKPDIQYNPTLNAASIRMVITEKSRVQFEVLDEKGEVVHISEGIYSSGLMHTNIPLVVGSRNSRLEGLITSNAPYASLLPPGDYQLVIRLRPVYSSYKFFQKVLIETVTIPRPTEGG